MTVLLILACTISTTAFSYFRVWDFIVLPSPANARYGETGTVRPSLSVNSEHGVAIGSDGTLWRWGIDVTRYDEFWDLSSEERSNSIDSYMIDDPVQVGSDSNWKQVISKRGGFLALKNDGTLWALGGWRRVRGNLETYFGSALGIDHIAQELTQVGTDSDWVKITGEARINCLGLKNDGSIWSWGMMNLPSNDGDVQWQAVITPAQLIGDSDWVDIAMLRNTNFALKTDGSIWMWGNWPENGFGFQNARGLIENPISFYDATPIEAIQSDGRVLLARQSDGQVLVWGAPGVKWIQGGLVGNPPWILDENLDWHNTNYEFSLLKDGSLTRHWGYLNSPLKPIGIYGHHWADFSNMFDFHYGITQEGTLWHWGRDFDEERESKLIPPRYHPESVAKLRADAN